MDSLRIYDVVYYTIRLTGWPLLKGFPTDEICLIHHDYGIYAILNILDESFQVEHLVIRVLLI